MVHTRDRRRYERAPRGGHARVLAFCAMVAWVAVGCGSAPGVKRHDVRLDHTSAPSKAASPVVVMEEPRFSGPFEPYEMFQKTHQAVGALSDARVPVVAPWEYRVEDRNAGLQGGSNIAWLLHEEGIDPAEVLRMETRVVMLSGTRRVDVFGDGEVRPADSGKALHGEVRVVLRGAQSETPLLTLVVGFDEEPGGEGASEVDRWPALGRAMGVVAEVLSGDLRGRFDIGGPHDDALDNVQAVFNPTIMLDYKANGLPSLREELIALDPLEARAAQVRYFQFFDAGVTLDQIDRFAADQVGVRVDAPGGLSRYGVKAGDTVLAVGDRDALGLQVVSRSLLRGRPVVLELRRAGSSVGHTVAIGSNAQASR